MKKLKSLLLLILLPTLLFSQEFPRDKQFIKDKYNIKLNYGLHNIDWEDGYKHSIGAEFNYGFTKWLDAGVFFEFTPISDMVQRDWDSVVVRTTEYGESVSLVGGTTMGFTHKVFNYGLNANIHILPFFIDPNFSWVDVYITPKIGMRTAYAKEIELLETNFYYSIGAGIGINFTRKIGIICEYNYARQFIVSGKYFNYPEPMNGDPLYLTGHMMRFGINIRF